MHLVLLLPGQGVHGQYRGGDASESDRFILLKSPVCNLPPFVPSQIYSGGQASEVDRADAFQTAVCGIPVFVPSMIYLGGADAGLVNAAILQNTVCSLPPFISSDIYKGGDQDTLDRAALISLNCNQGPPPPPPNIYTGGDAEGRDFVSLVQSGSCAVPLFVASDIYRGGTVGEYDRVELLQQPTCGINSAVASDIYKGGDESGTNLIAALQQPACSVPPVVVSTIYSGGISGVAYTQQAIQTPACAIPPPVTQGLYGGGAEFSLNSRKAEQPCPSSPPVVVEPYRGGVHSLLESVSFLQTPACALPVFTASAIYSGGSHGSDQSPSFNQVAVCALPLAVQSDIYRGGSIGLLTNAADLQQAVCSLPPFVASAIYTGGTHGAGMSESRIIVCGSGNLGPVVSDIYRGGSVGLNTRLSLEQQAPCSVPVFVNSDIYRGGDLGNQAAPALAQNGTCSLPVVVASDIYRGGFGGEGAFNQLAQFPVCGLPPFVNSAIYSGGNGTGYSQRINLTTLISSISLPSSILSICAGETVQLSATTNLSGTVNWFINGVSSFTGNPGILTGLADMDTVIATFVSSVSCAQPGPNIQDTVVIQANPGLGPNLILANPDLICFGSGGVPVGGLQVTGTGTIAYQWESSTNLLSWQGISGQDTSIFTGVLTNDTWYRRLVIASSCAGLDTSNIVQVSVSPSPTALFSGSTQTGACHVAFVDGWVLFPSSTNPTELLLSIRSINNGFDPAETAVTGYLLTGNPLVDGFRVLNRSYDIVPQNNGSAKIQFYFSQSDFDDLNLVEGGNLQVSDLLVTRFATGQTSNGQAIMPDAVIPDFPFTGVYTIEITVPGFSSFYIHGPDPAPLPVVLKSFNAECAETGIALAWETASEINNKQFIIQQSSDVSNWTTAGTVEGLGTSTAGKKYESHIPYSKVTGTYFRLVQEDFDGSTEVFPAISKICDNTEFRIGLHPNPAIDFVRFELASPQPGKGGLELMSSDGRKVLGRQISWHAGGVSEELDLRSLPRGMYMLVLRTDAGSTYASKLILH
jgi:hypothetical protein